MWKLNSTNCFLKTKPNQQIRFNLVGFLGSVQTLLFYGLMQVPRGWCNRLSIHFLSLDCCSSRANLYLFIYNNQHSQSVIYLFLYVKDVILTSNSNETFYCLLGSHIFTSKMWVLAIIFEVWRCNTPLMDSSSLKRSTLRIYFNEPTCFLDSYFHTHGPYFEYCF